MLETIFSSASELSVTPSNSLPFSRMLSRALLLILGGICAFGSSQAAIGQTGPEVIDVRPYTPTDGTSLESVSLMNGTLSVDIPVWSYPQRGKLKLAFSLSYDSISWAENYNCNAVGIAAGTPVPMDQSVVVNPAATSFPNACVPYVCPSEGQGAGVVCYLFWLPQATDIGFEPDSSFGISLSSSTDYAVIPVVGHTPPSSANQYFTGAFWKLRTPDRGSHKMVLTISGDYRAVDGTGWDYQSSTCTLTDRDGTRYVFQCTGPNATAIEEAPSNGPGPLSYIEDTNGNRITLNYNTSTNAFLGWTDTMGRNIPSLQSSPSANTSACPTAATSATAWNLPGVGVPVVMCSASVPIQTHLFPAYYYTSPAASDYFDYSKPETGLSGIIMPNGDSWSFIYTPLQGDAIYGTGYSYGDLTQINLPTGGSIQYHWGRQASFCGVEPDGTLVRSVLRSRTISTSSSSTPTTWTYGIQVPPLSDPATESTVVTDPLGNVTTHLQTDLGQCSYYETSVAHSDNLGNLLRSDSTSYQTLAQVPDILYANSRGYAALPTTTTTTWPDGKSVQKTVAYDAGYQTNQSANGATVSVPYGNKVSENDYDYGTGTTPGTLLRTVATNYWAFQVPAALSQNILSPPSSVVTIDTLANVQHTTTYAYDESPLASGNASVPVWDASPPNGSIRGNLTSVHRLLNTTGSNLVTTLTYANTGEIATLTQPANPAIAVAEKTSYGFSAAYSGGLLTSVTPPLWPGPTYSYYPTSLLLLSATGPNKEVTTYAYDDANRLQDLVGPPNPAGNQPEAVTNYLSVNEIESRVKQSEASWTIGQVMYDGVGRPTTTQHPDGCANGVNLSAVVGYDANGRANSKTNPYCSPSDPTYGNVVTTFDALDRPLTETEQDAISQRSWKYNDNTTTEYDELKNAWARTTDGLGRLIQVVEPGSLTTTYAYDGFDNLTGVTQSGKSGDTPRTRHFAYDSLNRLLASSNPETGTGLTCSGLSGTWSQCYSYDPDGNVQTKTDATGRITTFAYDAMNRVLSKRYSTDPSSTPTSCYQYDGSSVTNGVGRLAAEWTQAASSGACAATAPASGFYTETLISAYDAAGRIVSETQCTSPANCSASSPYPLQYSYDLAGNLISTTNGQTAGSADSMTFASSFDSLNRLASVSTQLGGTTPPANLTSSPSVLFQLPPTGGYGPLGLVSAQLAVNQTTGLPGIGESKSYDVRARSTGATFVAEKGSGSATTSGGSIAVSGEEISAPTGQANISLAVSGSEGSVTICTPVFRYGVPQPPVCHTTMDTGTLTIGVGQSPNVFSVSASYGGASTVSSMLQEFLTGFNNNSLSPVSASTDGSSLVLTSYVSGANGQYPVAITDGADFKATGATTLTVGTGPMVYDAGTVSVTIDNLTATAVWGQTDTASSVASSLYSAIKAKMAGVVTPTLNGTVVNLQSAGTGATTDFPVIVNVTDNTLGIDAPSFSFAAQGMTDGMATGEQTGTAIYSYSIPSGGYDADSNILAYTDSVNGSWSAFKYDGLNRLAGAAVTPVTGAAQYFCWYYDSFGNRRTQSTATAAFPADATGTCTNSAANANPIAYNANNQVTSTVQVPVVPAGAYDAAGKLVQDVEIVPGNRAVNQYVYDAAGNVCAVSASPLSGGTVMTGYLYNADGQRTAKGTIKALSCDPVVSGFAETNGYVLGSGGEQLTEMKNGVWAHSNVYAGGQMLATYDTQGLHFQMTDWLGSRRAQTNALGQIEQTCTSLPFGDGQLCTVPTGAPSTADDATEHHFTGKERDTESGLDYFGARYYASSMGRFMSPDWAAKAEPVPYAKLDDPQSLNLYTYGMNNPLSMVDDDGHFSRDSYVADNDKHGGPHIDRYNKQGQNVGRYKPDGTPMRHNGKTPEPVPNSDKGKFEDAKKDLNKQQMQAADDFIKQQPPIPNPPLPDGLKPDPTPAPSPVPPVTPIPLPSPGPMPAPTPPMPMPEPMPMPMPMPMPEPIPFPIIAGRIHQ